MLHGTALLSSLSHVADETGGGTTTLEFEEIVAHPPSSSNSVSEQKQVWTDVRWGQLMGGGNTSHRY